MNDQTFLAAFEDGTLPASEFGHRGHIHMAWLYLRRDGWEVGIDNIREGIQQFATRLGASGKYHETITLFWAHVVNYAISQDPDTDDFEAFSAAYPHLFDGRIMMQHYSPQRLNQGRYEWVEPDLLPLPDMA